MPRRCRHQIIQPPQRIHHCCFSQMPKVFPSSIQNHTGLRRTKGLLCALKPRIATCPAVSLLHKSTREPNQLVKCMPLIIGTDMLHIHATSMMSTMTVSSIAEETPLATTAGHLWGTWEVIPWSCAADEADESTSLSAWPAQGRAEAASGTHDTLATSA
jgi:hypothetical protein